MTGVMGFNYALEESGVGLEYTTYMRASALLPHMVGVPLLSLTRRGCPRDGGGGVVGYVYGLRNFTIFTTYMLTFPRI